MSGRAPTTEPGLFPRPDVPACLVLDVHLPDGSGLDLPSELPRAGDAIPIVFITGQGTIPMSVQAPQCDRSAHRERAEREALRARFARLTGRERHVPGLVGRMNGQIVGERGMAEQTVKQHRGDVMRTPGVQSVADLVRFVERHVSAAPYERSVSGAPTDA